MLANLPLEIWERILEYADDGTQYSLRHTTRSWKEHIDKRIIPQALHKGNYRILNVSILLFNGFHQYRNNQSLAFAGIRSAYHPYKETTQDYALFNIEDPLRYFKLNRLEDVDDLHITRDCVEFFVENCELKEARIIRKEQLRKELLIGPDEQSLLIPVHLLYQDDWELIVPMLMEPSAIDGVSVSLYGMGTPDQSWTTTFSSGANLPY